MQRFKGNCVAVEVLQSSGLKFKVQRRRHLNCPSDISTSLCNPSTLLCNTSTSVGHFNATLLHLNAAGISTLLCNTSTPQASQRNIVAFQPASAYQPQLRCSQLLIRTSQLRCIKPRTMRFSIIQFAMSQHERFRIALLQVS